MEQQASENNKDSWWTQVGCQVKVDVGNGEVMVAVGML